MHYNKIIFLLFFLIFITVKVSADTIPPSSDRQAILKILEERKEKFSSYTGSLDDASGIFGIKTKKDLKRSQKILVDIVRLDNRLIDVLNRRVDYKGYEAVDLNYKQLESDRKISEMRDAMALSDNRIENLNKKIMQQNAQINNRTTLSVFLAVLFFIALIRSYRKHIPKNP